MPKLSLANGLVYTYTKPQRSDDADAWYLTAIDFHTGETVWRRYAGEGLGYNNNFAPVTLDARRDRLRGRARRAHALRRRPVDARPNAAGTPRPGVQASSEGSERPILQAWVFERKERMRLRSLPRRSSASPSSKRSSRSSDSRDPLARLAAHAAGLPRPARARRRAARSATGARSRSPCSTSTASAQINLRHGYAVGDEVLGDGRRRDRATRPASTTSPAGRAATSSRILLAEIERPGGRICDRAPARAPRGRQSRARSAASRLSIGRRGAGGQADFRGGSSPRPREALEAGARRRRRPGRGLRGPRRRGDRDHGPGDVVVALVSALQERDRYTGDHSESVVEMSARVAEAMAVGPDEIERIRMARAAPRHRQGRRPRRDPAQARPARRRASGS